MWSKRYLRGRSGEPPERSRVGDLLRRRIAAGRPTSVIRLGDGEGVMLAAPDLAHPLAGPYLASHFGAHLTQAAVAALSARLREAVGRCWLLGVRQDVLGMDLPPDVLDRPEAELLRLVAAQPSLRPAERASLGYAEAFRLALLWQALTRDDLSATALTTSAWCHFEWLESGLLAELVRRAGRIGLVTGRGELVDVFRSNGIEVDAWLVPLRYHRRDAAWTPHFPDRFGELLETLFPVTPGQLFLVGAGICGKVYCDLIAQRGGIAIDIGAVCDAWLGIASRPLVARSRWGQENVPEHLLLARQLEARR